MASEDNTHAPQSAHTQSGAYKYTGLHNFTLYSCRCTYSISSTRHIIYLFSCSNVLLFSIVSSNNFIKYLYTFKKVKVHTSKVYRCTLLYFSLFQLLIAAIHIICMLIPLVKKARLSRHNFKCAQFPGAVLSYTYL